MILGRISVWICVICLVSCSQETLEQGRDTKLGIHPSTLYGAKGGSGKGKGGGNGSTNEPTDASSGSISVFKVPDCQAGGVATDIAVDSKGSLWVAAHCFATKSSGVYGNILRILKMNSEMTVLAQASITGQAPSDASLAIDGNDNVIVAARESYPHSPAGYTYITQAILVKLNNQANILWDKRFAWKDEHAGFRGVAVDNQNNIYANTLAKNKDGWLVKTNPQGETIWITSYQRLMHGERPYAYDPRINTPWWGQADIAISGSKLFLASEDYLEERDRKTGNVIWHVPVAFNYSNIETVRELVPNGAGSLYLVNRKKISTFTESGAYLGVIAYGTSGTLFQNATIDASNGLFTTGTITSVTQGEDVYMGMYEDTGNVLWEDYYGGSKTKEIGHAAVSLNGHAYIAAECWSKIKRACVIVRK